MAIADNVARVREQIAGAAERAGRAASDVTLVAVSKTFPAATIREAYAAGLRHFGENRVQEWERKHAALGDLHDATWHLVGHLQSNKARRATLLFHAIDCVDSVPLAEKLNGFAALPLQVLIEVRLAPEETKSGVEPDNLPRLAEAIAELPHLELRGLMCVPPFCERAEEARLFFARLRAQRDALEPRIGRRLPELSMGMSHDFEVAIAEGATQVRVGTAIFGERGKN